MSPKQKKLLVRIIVGAVLFFTLLVLFKTVLNDYEGTWPEAVVFLVPYLIVGYDILVKAFKNICHGHVFDENFLMIVAGIGAYGTGEYEEAVAVMLFFQVGELFQSYAVGKSRQSISDLMDIAPEYANVIGEDGSVEQVDPDEVELDSMIVIRPGEKVPIDCVVVEGDSYLDTASLTGESRKKHVLHGSDVISGCINGAGTLKCRTTKAYEDSTVAKILELVENAGSRKSRTENFITRFAKVYTPTVTIAAVILAVVPSLITGNWAEWIRRACTFLVISCPCALVISVPMGFFGGIGAASRNGILVKGSNYLEAVTRISTAVFDKTGTLTKGCFEVTRIEPSGCDEKELLMLAARSEAFSAHPIAEAVIRAFRERYSSEEDLTEGLSDHNEIAGHGISVKYNGTAILSGNEKLMRDNNVAFTPASGSGTVVYVAADGVFKGAVIITDVLKPGIKEALAELKASGIRRTVMLTGDRESTARELAGELGIDEYHAELLPADKVAQVENIIGKTDENSGLAFVGDGINDAPVLTRAHVGFAMGSLGSDAAIEAADVVIMDDDIGKIAVLRRIAAKTLRIVRENIVFALGIKFTVLILGALGIANMWLAVFADVGVAVIAILNSMRTLKVRSDG